MSALGINHRKRDFYLAPTRHGVRSPRKTQDSVLGYFQPHLSKLAFGQLLFCLHQQ